MRLVGLISGGKDSVFNMLHCVAAGHEIVAVANIEPDSSDELDSYMYQSVGQEAVTLVAGALCLPIFRQKTKGKAICKSKTYVVTPDDEVEDLFSLLSKVKKSVNIGGVSVGAIASDYQRMRVENVCSRLGLVCFAYLWKRNQSELLQEMIDAELDAIIIKVASIGLEPNSHLGMHLHDIQAHLVDLNKKYGVNICGEGGEYETLTLDCPLFHRSINITESENKIWSNDAFAPVGFLNVKNATLSLKQWGNVDSGVIIQEKIKLVQSVVKGPYFYVQDCVDELSQTIFPEKHYSKHEDLPFPFEIENESENESEQNSATELPEYWKNYNCKKLYSSMKSQVKLTNSLLDTAVFTLIYSSGWCCIGNVTAPDLNEALICLKRHLERMGYDFSDLVFINLFVKNMSDYVNLNKIYSDFIKEVSPPARTCVGTILSPEIDVILIIVAHKVVSKTKKALKTSKSEREIMHVQSISHWAPANIGPYSQCVKIGGIYYLAGQIPLVPGTMEILNKPIYHQCRLALRHILRVLQAMNERLNYSNVLQALCYVVSNQIAADMVALWPYITEISNTPVAAVVVCELPKKAQLEWEVLAGDFGDPEGNLKHYNYLQTPGVSTITDIIEDFHLEMNRYFYLENNVCSMVCKVSFMKKSQSKISGKSLKFVTSEGLINVLKTSIHFLKKDLTGSPLCMLKVFYKASDTPVAAVVNEVARSSLDLKVVLTAIPVVECEEPDIILTITGVCH